MFVFINELVDFGGEGVVIVIWIGGLVIMVYFLIVRVIVIVIKSFCIIVFNCGKLKLVIDRF